MFINRLLNQGPTPVIEQMLKFTDKRANLLAEDITNLSTPNYQNQDVSLDKFQSLLSKQAEQRDRQAPAQTAANDDTFPDVASRIENPSDNIQFHDRNNRSVEQLMSDQAQNAMMHNMMIELLRKQFSQIQEALREKVS